MSPDQNHISIGSILDRFKTGALLNAEGRYYSDRKLSDEGLRLIRQSLKELDSLGPDSRNALIPLLDDPTPIIRVRAAASLVNIIPERALAVLEEIRDRSLSDANSTASNVLILYEQGLLNH